MLSPLPWAALVCLYSNSGNNDLVILKFCKVKAEFEKEKAILQYLNSFPDASQHVRCFEIEPALSEHVISVLGFSHVFTLSLSPNARSPTSYNRSNTTTGRQVHRLYPRLDEPTRGVHGCHCHGEGRPDSGGDLRQPAGDGQGRARGG